MSRDSVACVYSALVLIGLLWFLTLDAKYHFFSAQEDDTIPQTCATP